MAARRGAGAWPAPPDTSGARAELDAALAGCPREQREAVWAGEVDPVLARAARLPVLSAGAADELAASYRHGLVVREALRAGRVSAAAQRRAQAELAVCEADTEALLGTMARLVRTLIVERLGPVLGEARLGAEMADLTAAAHVLVLEAARSHDPARGPVVAWAAAHLRRELPRLAGPVLRSGALPETWERALRFLGPVVVECEQRLGRRASLAELREALVVSCLAHYARGVPAQVAALGPAEVEAAARARMVKDGMAAVLRDHLGELLVLRGAEERLDAPVGEDAGVTLGERLAGAEAAEVAGEDRSAALMAAAVAGMGDGVAVRAAVAVLSGAGEASLAGTAARFGAEPVEVARVLRSVRARLGAPQVQFAFWSPTLAGQFDAPVAGAGVGAAAARLAVLAAA